MTQAYTNQFTEVCYPLGAIYPETAAIGTHTFGYVNTANYQRGIVLIMVGDMAQGATLDVQVWQATDDAGTDAKIVTGKAITQLTQAAGDGDDLLAIEVRTEELDVDGGFSYVSVVVTVAAGTVDLAVLGLGFTSNYPPVPVTGWTEIVD